MVKIAPRKEIIKDTNAISEEFTSLPALTIVLIGFTLFILIITNSYNAYNIRIDSIDKYQSASFISDKLTNPDCYFIMEGGMINLPLLDSVDPADSDDRLNHMRKEIRSSGVNFSIQINWDNNIKYFPEDTKPTNVGDKVAASKTVSLYLNEAQTKPGKLTVITWRI